MHGTSAGAIDRASWLAERRKGIGGSDAAALFGVHPWMSPYKLYQEKIGAIRDEEQNLPMRRGVLMEPAVRDAYGIELQRAVGPGVVLARHSELPFVMVNTDGTIEPVPEYDGPGDYEGKTTISWNAESWDHGVPLYYQVQVQHAMAVTGRTWSSVCVFVIDERFNERLLELLLKHEARDEAFNADLVESILGNTNRMRWMDVQRNDRFIEALLERESAFWRHHVEAGIPPDPDGHTETSRAIDLLYPDAVTKVVTLPDDAAEWAEKLRAAKADKKAAEQVEKLYKNKLRAAIGDAAFARLPGTDEGFSLKTTSRSGYTVKPTSYRSLKSIGKKALDKAERDARLAAAAQGENDGDS